MIATLIEQRSWSMLYGLTSGACSSVSTDGLALNWKDIHEGEILGARVVREWREDRDQENDLGPRFEIVHKDFTVFLLRDDLMEASRSKIPANERMIPCYLAGSFDAFEDFRLILKIID